MTQPNQDAKDPLDELSEESFPASDPPGWSAVVGTGDTAGSGSDKAIEHNEQARRFESRFPEGRAALEYRYDSKGALVLLWTEVPPALRRRGIGARLVERALAYAREHHLRVVPQCGFVASYIEQHPESHSLVSEK
jgi:hypothetical protein